MVDTANSCAVVIDFLLFNQDFVKTAELMEHAGKWKKKSLTQLPNVHKDCTCYTLVP